jgi:hypothetical protein
MLMIKDDALGFVLLLQNRQGPRVLLYTNTMEPESVKVH